MSQVSLFLEHIRSNSGSDGCNIRASTRNKDKNSISCPDAKICHMSSKIVAGARWSIVFFHNRFAFLQKLDLFDNPVVQPSDRGPPATGDSKISKMEATRIDFFFNHRWFSRQRRYNFRFSSAKLSNSYGSVLNQWDCELLHHFSKPLKGTFQHPTSIGLKRVLFMSLYGFP